MLTNLDDYLQALLDGLKLHPILQAIVLVLCFTALAWLANGSLSLILGRWARNTKSDLDDRLVEMLKRPVFVSVVLLGVYLALHRLSLPDPLPRLILATLKTVGILVWLRFGFLLCSWTLEVLARLQNRLPIVQPRTVPLFDNLIKVFITGGAVYMVLLSWDIDVSGWLASAGIVGIAVGFAAKDTLANLFAGVFILADAPYKLGDYVNLGSGERGKVTQIGIRSTRLLTRDDIEVTVPNAVIGSDTIVNETGGRWDKLRIRIPVGVAYGSDVDQVRKILTEIALEEEQVCADPTPSVRFRSFGESSLDFQLRGWIKEPELRGRVIDILLTKIYKRFNEAGIEFPYPKRDLYVRDWPGAAPKANPAPTDDRESGEA